MGAHGLTWSVFDGLFTLARLGVVQQVGGQTFAGDRQCFESENGHHI